METSLSMLRMGKDAKIKYLLGGMGLQRKIRALGIRIGKTVRVVSYQPFRGPVIVEVDGMRIAIGRGMASQIIVEE